MPKRKNVTPNTVLYSMHKREDIVNIANTIPDLNDLSPYTFNIGLFYLLCNQFSRNLNFTNTIKHT